MGGPTTLTNCTLYGNTATINGGGRTVPGGHSGPELRDSDQLHSQQEQCLQQGRRRVPIQWLVPGASLDHRGEYRASRKRHLWGRFFPIELFGLQPVRHVLEPGLSTCKGRRQNQQPRADNTGRLRRADPDPALLPTSPARNLVGRNGLINPPVTDQRGYARNSTGTNDAGAFQFLTQVLDQQRPAAGQHALRLGRSERPARPARGGQPGQPGQSGHDDHLRRQPQRADDHIDGRPARAKDSTGTQTIKDEAAGVTVSGNNASRVFQIDAGVTANLSRSDHHRGNF